MHCDTILKLYEHPGTTLRNNSFQIDLTRMKASLIDFQNFALFVENEAVLDPYQRYQELYQIYQRELAANSDIIRPVYCYQDYLDNQTQGYLSAMLTMEEGAPLAGSKERLEAVYQDGVRMLTLTWNQPNEIGFPNAIYADAHNRLLPVPQKGLTSVGFELVERMTQLGMIIDVSHGSDQLVHDVLATTTVPFVASHSNCRALCPHSRNLPDDLIRQMGTRGCVIGLNYFEAFIRFHDHATLLEQLANHAAHLKNIGGLDCIGLGSDFDGIVPHPELVDNLSVERLIDTFKKTGFTAREIDAIGFQNVARLYQEIL